MNGNAKAILGWVAGILFFGGIFLLPGSDSNITPASASPDSSYSEPSTPSYNPSEDEPDASDSGDCDPGYSGCVPNVSYDLDCADIGESVEVYDDDPHGFDADGDGWGCDTY